MVSRIPISEAKARLDDLADRVSAGEEFIIERGGTDVLRISRASAPVGTMNELVSLLTTLPVPDDEYLDELERLSRNQGTAPATLWE